MTVPAKKKSGKAAAAAKRPVAPKRRPAPAKALKGAAANATKPGVAKPEASPEAAGWVLTGQSELHMPALLHYVRQRRCALFVGAGLSAGAGLPTWHGLMERIIRRVAPFAITAEQRAVLLKEIERVKRPEGPDWLNPLPQREVLPFFADVLSHERAEALFGPVGRIDRTQGLAFSEAEHRILADTSTALELEELLAAGKFAELAGYCRDLLGREVFHEELRAALQVTGDIPETHRAIVDTPYACIVTTNFDSLLEDAHARWSPRGVPKAPTGAELAQQGTLLFDESFFILKAHGDLDDESSIVLTSEDYRRVIHSTPAFQATMQGILQRYAVLFVGYSLSDINFRLLLDDQLTTYGEHVPPRYALMEDVGPAAREILWRTARLRVISYPKTEHAVVGRVLRHLAAGGQSGTPAVAPTPPAAHPRMLRPQPTWHVELEIRSNGNGLNVRLQECGADGRMRQTWAGGCHWPEWARLKTQMRRLADAGDRPELMTINAIGSELQRAWPEELRRGLESTPAHLPVLLNLDAATETVPWEWAIVQGSPLCLRNPVVRRPSGISDRSRGLRLAGSPLRALLIGDAGDGSGSPQSISLPAARKEVEHIARLLNPQGPSNTVTLVNGKDAVYSRLVREVEDGEYDIVHFAGVAMLDAGEVLLCLWDGRINSAELASILNRNPPSLLVLNSHYTAFAPCGIFDKSALPGTEVRPPGVDRPVPPAMGFMGLASRSGVGAFVGNFSGGVPDEMASRFAIAFYEELVQGKDFSDALHQARTSAASVTETNAMSYIGSGYAGLNFRHAFPLSR